MVEKGIILPDFSGTGRTRQEGSRKWIHEEYPPSLVPLSSRPRIPPISVPKSFDDRPGSVIPSVTRKKGRVVGTVFQSSFS